MTSLKPKQKLYDATVAAIAYEADTVAGSDAAVRRLLLHGCLEVMKCRCGCTPTDRLRRSRLRPASRVWLSCDIDNGCSNAGCPATMMRRILFAVAQVRNRSDTERHSSTATQEAWCRSALAAASARDASEARRIRF